MWNKIKTFFQTLWINIKKAFLKSLIWIIPLSIIAIIIFFIIRKLSDPTDSAKEFEQLVQTFKTDWQTKKQDVNNKVNEMNKQIDQIKKDQADRQNNAGQYIKPKI